MLDFLKPAHVRLHRLLPEPMARRYDEARSAILPAIPVDWRKPARDRAVAIVMAEWVVANAGVTPLEIPSEAYAKAVHFAWRCRELNARDAAGEGGASTALADSLIRCLRQSGTIPDEYFGYFPHP